MKHSKKILALLISATTTTPHLLANENTEPGKLSTVKVTADTLSDTTEQTDSYTTGSMSTATKLDLSIRETPQSVSVISRTQLDDYHLTTVNDALQNAPGVTVERAETDRTYYTARGFDITNFQEDGLGIPLYWGLSTGDTDTAIYDRIEVVRGADGLTAGVGNPSATINKVRKRPTRDFQAATGLSAGSWDDYRIEGDLSGSLTEAVRGRAVVAQQTKKSYLNDYAKDLSVGYAIIEADLSSNSLLSIGFSQQKSNANSPMWGAVTLAYSDGTPTDFSVSTNTSADWSYWDVTERKSFIELNHSFANGWMAKASYSHTDHSEDSELFYVYGDLDSQTNQGLTGWAGKYNTERNLDQFDIYTSGKFSLAGREHDLVVGATWASSDALATEDSDTTSGNGFPDIGDFSRWRGDTPRPSFVRVDGSGANMEDKQTAIYSATHVHLSDKLSLIAGARLANFESSGISYYTSVDSKENNKLIPYGGLTYDINQNYSLYASYSETFLPQAEMDENLQRLAPTEGVSNELGIKGEFFDKNLNASAAIFSAENRNLAEANGMVDGISIYRGVDYDSRGIELELSGKLTEKLNTSLGYTNLTLDNMQGEVAKTYIPKQIFKLATSYQLLAPLKLGASLNWQSDIYRRDTPIKQQSYQLINLFANYQFRNGIALAVNLNNASDEKYINSIMWDQGFYGAPRNITASLNWKY